MSRPVIIFGTSDIAKLAHFYFTHDSSTRVVAFTADNTHLTSKSFLNLPAVAFETVEQDFPPNDFDMFIAIGYADVNRLRSKKCKEARQKGYRLKSYVSSKAILWTNTNFGDNCFILENNNIQPYVQIGNNVTLWSGNHIGHDSIIEDDCFISSHVVVSGGVTLKKGCFLGVNATLRDHIVLGEYSIIGAGVTLLQNAEPYSVYASPRIKPLPHKSNELKHL